jgi:hypothetical protein
MFATDAIKQVEPLVRMVTLLELKDQEVVKIRWMPPIEVCFIQNSIVVF